MNSTALPDSFFHFTEVKKKAAKTQIKLYMKIYSVCIKSGFFLLIAFILSSCESGTRQVSEQEYEEFQNWKSSQNRMSFSMAPPPTSGPYYKTIDSTRAHCLIKNFYEDKNMYLRVMNADSTYAEMKSFHFDKASIMSIIGDSAGQKNLDGIRFYFGESYVDSLPVHSIIMVGTTINGTYSDGVTMYSNVKTPYYLDFASPCPQRCSDDPSMTGDDQPFIFEYTNCPTNQ